jgi:hypothetical protein
MVDPKTPILKTTATGKQYYEIPLTRMEKYETINGVLIMCPADKEVYLKCYYKTVCGTENRIVPPLHDYDLALICCSFGRNARV